MSDVNNTHLGMSHLGDVSLSLIELSEAYWLCLKTAKQLFLDDTIFLSYCSRL